ncbi:MAG: O-antigen ligase family protein [Elusimicrobiota bacterium]
MILPALLALAVALGPLLRGCWDIWAQALIHQAAVCGIILWLLSRVIVGYVPLPSRRNLLWAVLLTALGTASVVRSPVHALVLPEWYNFLNALWIFPIMAAVSKDERQHVDIALRAAAWILMALAFYQHFRLGEARPASALVNENVFAGTILLLLPLALEKKDWLLAGGLFVNLLWTRSVGAWLGLAVALLVTQRGRRAVWFWAGLALGLLCAVAVYNKLQSPDVLNRLYWWQAAVAMICERPLTGFGPGAYAPVLPAVAAKEGVFSGYAHQYFLQTAAEYGIVFTGIWLAGLWSCVVRGSSYKRFGALALLVYSCCDWSLSMPANLWLFSYFAASSISEGSQGVNVPTRFKLPCCALLLLIGGFLTVRILHLWAADRAKTRAVAALHSGDLAAARAAGEAAARHVARDPDTQELLAAADLGRTAGRGAGDSALRSAAGHLEKAAQWNPYRARTWAALADVRGRLGDGPGAAAARRDGARWSLRYRRGLEKESAR